MVSRLSRSILVSLLIGIGFASPGMVAAQQAADAPQQQAAEAPQQQAVDPPQQAAAPAQEEKKEGGGGFFSSLGSIFGGNSNSGDQQGEGKGEEKKKEEEGPKNLLANLELGEKLHREKSFDASLKAWMEADRYVRAWEDEAKNSPEKLLQEMGEGLGSLLINDSVRRYDGTDYERTALATKLALAHLALGSWENARTEVRKMHERETIITEFRSKEVESLKGEREAKKVQEKEIKDLKGYPVETLDNPEVTSLRNSYQSAFGHYLAGFVYEQAGEASLAAAGYRQAIELRPDIPVLQNALSGLDGRVGKNSHKVTDTLFVIEAGKIPARTSTTIPLPVPTRSGLVFVPTSFPSIAAPAPNPMPSTITVDGKSVEVAAITSYDSMARRELKDSMPGVITRGTVRAIAKGLINSEAQQHFGLFGAILSTVLTTATEKADVRMWGSLPSHVGVARVALAPGKHTVEVGGATSEIEVMGAYSLAAMRLDSAGAFVKVATTPKIEEPVVVAKAKPPEGSAKARPSAKKPGAKKEKAK